MGKGRKMKEEFHCKEMIIKMVLITIVFVIIHFVMVGGIK